MKPASRRAPSDPDHEAGCAICGLPATALVNEVPGCSDHVALLYERQLERSATAKLKMPQSLNGDKYGRF